MRKKIILILISTMIISLFSVPTYGLGKTKTHTSSSYWMSSKSSPPSTYYYDDGDYYGTLRLKNTTWSESTQTNTKSSSLLSNSKSSLRKDIDEWYGLFLSWFRAGSHGYGGPYVDPAIIDGEWTSSRQEGTFTGWGGGVFDYKRSYWIKYTYTAFRYTAVYEGTITAYNEPPELTNAKILNQKNPFTDQDKINIQVTVKDVDIGDKLTLYVDGVSYGTITANGSEQIMTASVKANSNLNIHIKDTKAAESNHKNLSAGEIVNILEQSSIDINKFITPEKNSDLRFVIANTEDSVTTSTKNSDMIDSIKTQLLDRDSQMYMVGDSQTSAYLKGDLTDNEAFSLDDGTEENNIIDFIIKQRDDFLGRNTNIFVVGEEISNNLIFEDLEKDYDDISITNKLKENTDLDSILKKPKNGKVSIKYIHDPSVFDNPVTKSSKDDGSYHDISYLLDSGFLITEALAELRGEWILYLNGEDKTGVDIYDKQADEKEYKFVIHQKPKAIITSWKAESTNEIYVSASQSFDIDYEYSKANNGIKEYIWKYQLTDGTWNELPLREKRAVLKKSYGLSVVNYSLTVVDYHGATDTTVQSIEKPLDVPENPIEDMKLTLTPSYPIGIPASEEMDILVEVTASGIDIEKVEGELEGETLINLDLIEDKGAITIWGKTITIPELKADKDYYDFRATAFTIYGDDYREDKVNVLTPINLSPSVPQEINTNVDKTFFISANTSIYANTVKVTAFKGSLAEQTIDLLLNETLEDSKGWNVEVDTPLDVDGNPIISDGIYDFEFVATTPNGNLETITLQMKLTSIKIENFRVKHITDFNWKNLFYNEDLSPKSLYDIGIKVFEMPIFKNGTGDAIKLGYNLKCAFDSIGLNENGDSVDVEVSFYVFDGTSYIEADLYVVDDESNILKPIDESLFKPKSVSLSLANLNRYKHEVNSDASYNTWYFDYYLPPKTIAVRKGERLDLMNDNTLKGYLLVNMNIVGYKNTGFVYDYMQYETNWSTADGSVYGESKKSALDITGKGVNRGDVFYYDLSTSLIEDLKLYREW